MRRRSLLAGLAASSVGVLLPHGTGSAEAAPRAAGFGSGAPSPSGTIVARQIDHASPATLGTLETRSGQRVALASASAIGIAPADTGATGIALTDTGIAFAGAGATGGETLSVTSPVIDAGQLFEHVGAHFRAAPGSAGAISVEVRASADGATWSDWVALRVDDHLTDTAAGTDTAASTYYLPPRRMPLIARYAQYRAWIARADDLEHIALTVLDVNDLNVPPLARLASSVGGAIAGAIGGALGGLATGGQAMAAPTGPSRILTRADWGADERLMKWPPKYVPATKAVIHHTVTDDGGSSVAATIRTIYYFHAVTRGWGDIGYSYIVDKFGNIWTGRQGGDNAVAGHAYGWNDGSIGIAALGDYSSRAPSGQLQGAIANVIAMKLKQLGIQPFGSGAFTHEEQRADGAWIKVAGVVANVLGHRDCTYVVGKTGAQTGCPGSIYEMLGGLRGQAQAAWQNGYTAMTKIDPQLAGGGVPGQVLNVPVAITNLGTQPIPAGTLVNYRILKSGAPVAQGPGAAIAQALGPGALTTLTAPFLVPAIGEYIVRWDLQTGGSWWGEMFNTPVRDQWFRAADWSADWQSDNVTRQWTAGEVRVVTVTVRNDGGRVWPAAGLNPVRLGYYWISTATGNRFEGPTQQALPGDVAPGQTITLTLPVVAPVYPTNYTLVLDLHKENEFWFKDKGLRPDDTETTVATDFKAAYGIGSPLPPFQAGATATVPVTITNLGRGTFPITGSYPITLGYHWVDGAGNAVVWDSPRTKLPADLPSQQSVTLPAQVTAPAKGGAFRLRFDLVQEGLAWFSTKGVAAVEQLVAVEGPVVPVYGATYQPGATSLGQAAGLAAVPITVTNRGNFTWPAAGANPVTLSYHWLDRLGRMAQWDGLRTKLPADVAPGASVALNAQVAFPSQQGPYTLRWDLVHEGVAWFSGKGVPTLDQSAIVGPAPSYGGSIDVSKVPALMSTLMAAAVPLRVQNMSSFPWDGNVNLAYHWYDASGKVVVWDGARTSLAGLAPGELRSLTAVVEGPAMPGAYTLKFDIVREGVTWFSGQGMLLAPVAVAVQLPAIGALYGGPAQAAGAAGAAVTIPVTVTNTGMLHWAPGQINLAYHLYTAAGALVAWDGARTPLGQPLGRGQQQVVGAQVKAPATAGAYVIKWDLVQEGITWFSGQGVPLGSTTLLIQ